MDAVLPPVLMLLLWSSWCGEDLVADGDADASMYTMQSSSWPDAPLLFSISWLAAGLLSLLGQQSLEARESAADLSRFNDSLRPSFMPNSPALLIMELPAKETADFRERTRDSESCKHQNRAEEAQDVERSWRQETSSGTAARLL